MFKKVLWVGVVRSCACLVAKPSQVGVDADGISCPQYRCTACGCQPDALCLWFRKVFPCLVAKPSFVGVTALTGPHVMTVRLEHRALGLMPPDLITPCGVVLSLHQPYPVAWKLLRWLALPWWRMFESQGGSCRPCILKGRTLLAWTWKVLESRVWEPSG
jgi:hypothetical protein